MAHVETESISWTAADLLERLGAIPLVRIRQLPAPGTAVEQDAIDINERKIGLCELIDGILVEKTVGAYESYLAVLIASLLRVFVVENKLGFVLGSDSMSRLELDQIRIPDAAFYSWSRFPDRRVPRTAYVDMAPDLAVEVISPSNTRQEMDRKLTDYFSAGTRLVWYIYPSRREVVVFQSPTSQRVLQETEVLDGGDVLPGFQLRLTDYFAEP
jgi:Uma2 family endonuclease